MPGRIFTGTLNAGVGPFARRYFPADAEVGERLGDFLKQVFRDSQSSTCPYDYFPLEPDPETRDTLCRLLDDIPEGTVWADADISLVLGLFDEYDKELQFVFFYTAPETELARFLLSSENGDQIGQIESVLSAWRQRAEQMLEWHTRSDTDTRLFNAEYIHRHPQVLADTGTARDEVPQISQDGHFDAPLFDFYRYIALSILVDEPRLDELYSELVVMASHGGNGAGYRDLHQRRGELLSRILPRLFSQQQAGISAKVPESENVMLRELLTQTQKELERQYFKAEETAAINAEYQEFLQANALFQLGDMPGESATDTADSGGGPA